MNAAVTGLVAGVSGVVITRALFGPRLAGAGAAIGVVAVVVGATFSLALTDPRRRSGTGAGTVAGAVARRRVRRRTRPLAWFAPVVGSLVAMVAWAGVAHSSGAGWVQAVGALLAAVLFTGLAAPYLPARRSTLRCTACPSDGQAGQRVELVVTASGPLRITPRVPGGPTTRSGGRAHGPRPASVVLVPERRGVIETVVIELASSAPFGLLWWAREVEVALPRPLHVAPRDGEAATPRAGPDEPAGDAATRTPSDGGEPRGVRPYRPGDSRRSIHWGATSHVGSLMVRERERQTDDPVLVEVVLPDDPAAAARAAERMMATVGGELARGRPVILATTEERGRTVALVRDRVDLGRRLARAVGSTPGYGPDAPAPGPDAPRRPLR